MQQSQASQSFATTFCTKEEAKRLLFLFPKFVQQIPRAGRIEGKHTDPNNDSIAITHPFGRSKRLASTTNGFTFELEWSNACSVLSDEHQVIVQLFKHKSARAWIIRVAPGHCNEPRNQGLKFDLRPHCIRIEFGTRHFNWLRADITAQAWQIFQHDFWKFDNHVVEINGNLTCVWNREKNSILV